ncbi:uncharacterized protein LOC144877700 [Branchiostoma floridae x Branchiostoma japonicum]
MIRIEFQARGSPHAHSILWIKDAPQINVDSDEDVVKFINEHITCSIPEENDEELRKLVLSVQKHGHSATCRREQKCRFRFPRPPSQETLIARQSEDPNAANIERDLKIKTEILKSVRAVIDNSNVDDNISLDIVLEKANVDPALYHKVLQTTKSGKDIVLKREVSETSINPYNPHILRTWAANMDVQYILDVYACIMYITSYMLKSERSMSELLKKVAEDSKGEDVKARLRKVGSAFLNSREVSAQETAYRLLSLWLKKMSRRVLFVNSASKDKRVSILKPHTVLKDMADDQEDIFCTSLQDRYASRPAALKDMCLLEFAATYNPAKDNISTDISDHNPDHDELQNYEGDTGDVTCQPRGPPVITLHNGLGKMKKRKKHCIVRFHKEKREGEERYRNMLMLYLPWKDEDVDLKRHFRSFKEHFDQVKDIVQTNESKFSVNATQVEQACEDLERMGPMDDMWNDVAPNVEFLQSEQLAEGSVKDRDLPMEDQFENVDLSNDSTRSNCSEICARFKAEADKTLLTSEEYRAMMRSLTHKQLEVVMYHRQWCKKAIFALKHKHTMPQYTIFLSGPGGVGKSHIIKLVHYLTLKLLKPHSGHFQPDELPLLLTAFTGTAAFGIQGMTLHSALGFTCGPNRDNRYVPPSCEKLQALRKHLGKLKLLVIDEVSMVGADLLYHIHRRLQDICGDADPDSRFGGVSILAVGDLFQLQPVGQGHVFADPSDRYARLHGSLWQEKIEMLELTETVRQRSDKVFADLLQRVRTGDCTEEDMDLLRTRVIDKDDADYPVDALHIFKTNQDVDDHNEAQLARSTTDIFHIKAIDRRKDVQTGLVNIAFPKKPSETGNLREYVHVSVGARVMVTVNIDVADGLSNGVLGTVIGIDKLGEDIQTIVVRFDSDNVGRQAIANSQFKQKFPHAVPIKRHTAQFPVGKGRSVLGERTQFPLTLAWGCTIHKVQGRTLDKVVMSMQGRGRFMPGQAYVGLSRVKKLSNLYLLGFDQNAIRVNSAVKDEMTRLRQTNVQNEQINYSPPSADTVLTIGYLNIRSFEQHLKDFKAHHSALKHEVFCFVETFLRHDQEGAHCSDYSQVDLRLPWTKCFRTDRLSTIGRGGGVMIMAGDHVSPIELRCAAARLEYTAVIVKKAHTEVNIVTVYRPPNLPLPFLMGQLTSLLASIDKTKPTIVVGDFNVDLITSPCHNP